MSARYHPIVDTLWDDEALEGLPFEGKAFFCFLCSNRRLRPSGIYRASDEQLAVESGLAVRKVRDYLGTLFTRRRIVRDGAWIFVRGYFGRQPKGERLLLGVQSDINDCSSVPVLTAFGERYPHLRKWSDDRLVKVTRPCSQLVPTEQSSTEQSSTEHVLPGASETPPPADTNTPSEAMREVFSVVDRCPAFRASARLRDEAFWLHEIRANPDIDVLAQTLKAQAWLTAHPRQTKRDVVRFLHNWYANPLARNGQ